MLYYDEYGSNKQNELLFCHGIFGRRNNFRSIARAFEDKCKVYCVDMLGHGDSPRSKSLAYDNFALSLKEFAQEKMEIPINVIGHSMGGKAIMSLAFMFPQIVNKMVILDVGIKENATFHDYTQGVVMKSLASIDLNSVKSRKEVILSLTESGVKKLDALFIAQSLQKDDEKGFYWMFDLEALLEYSRGMNESIIKGNEISDKDVLFLRGEHSNFILDEDIKGIKKHFPNSIIKTIPASGHNVHIDNAEETIKNIKDFFNL